MELSRELLEQVVADLSADDARVRGAAADSVLDWISAYDADSGAVVSAALAAALDREVVEETAEAQLHALAELAEWDLVPRDIAARLVSDRKWNATWAAEYFEYLGEYAGE